MYSVYTHTHRGSERKIFSYSGDLRTCIPGESEKIWYHPNTFLFAKESKNT